MKYKASFLQRAAGGCKAVGNVLEIPPGVVFLKKAVGKNGSARYSLRFNAPRAMLRGMAESEVVPRILRPLSVRTGDFLF